MKPIRSTIRMLFAAAAALAVSCGNRGTKAAAEAPQQRHQLTAPQPSAMLANDSVRLDYVASHFWDSFDRRDTTWIADTAAMERVFADWAGMLRHLPETKAAENITAFFRSAEVCPPMRDRLLELAERYFYDPNSPLRNEAWYIPVLQYVISSPAIEDAYKIRPRYQLEMALKNRPGMKATDFVYTLADGRTGRLHRLQGEYTLLFFYNPDCPDCALTEKHIVHSPVFGPLIASGRVKVLAVYTDEDIDLWRERLSWMPADWTVAYDKGRLLTKGGLYDLRAIPTLYLLDRDKRVILKDAPGGYIEAWLARQQNR